MTIRLLINHFFSAFPARFQKSEKRQAVLPGFQDALFTAPQFPRPAPLSPGWRASVSARGERHSGASEPEEALSALSWNYISQRYKDPAKPFPLTL